MVLAKGHAACTVTAGNNPCLIGLFKKAQLVVNLRTIQGLLLLSQTAYEHTVVTRVHVPPAAQLFS